MAPASVAITNTAHVTRIAIHRKFQTRRVAEDSTRLYGEATQHSMKLSVDGYTSSQFSTTSLVHAPSNTSGSMNCFCPLTAAIKLTRLNRPKIIGGRMDWIRQLCPIRLFGDSTPLQILLAECVADGTRQSALVEPVHPFQCRKLHVACTTPALACNDFRLVQANDAFRQCVVVGVADCTHRCFHACLLQPCAVTQRQERVPVIFHRNITG